MVNKNDIYWMWVSLACSAGSNAGDILIDNFGYDSEAIFNADKHDYADLDLKPEVVQALLDKDLVQTKEIYDYCKQNSVGILTLSSEKYPNRLKEIRTRPLVLYYKGKLPSPDIESNVCIATVGTRRMSEYGKRSAYTISYDLARGGAIVVSGMALGVDGVCHRGALDAGGYTIAVLGNGIDRAYPPEHAMLMDEIIHRGLVITEYRPFTPPVGEHFPVRNRIISGLSQGTLIIEADSRSGALITSKTALFQGRDVFSLPGKIGEQNSVGTNRLIQDGAKMITNAIDILEEYETLYPDKINIKNLPMVKLKSYQQNYNPKTKPEPKPKPKSEQETITPKTELPDNLKFTEKAVIERIINCMTFEPATTDDIALISEIDVSEVMMAMTELELSGVVKSVPGGKYVKQK